MCRISTMTKRTKKGGAWGNPNFVPSAAAARLANALLLGKKLRRKARTGLAIGTFLIELPCSATLNALGLAGFDFVVLDLEHSAIDFSNLQQLITAAHGAGLATLVRPLSGDTHCIGKILDLGANGIMVPHVDSVDKARRIAEQAHFPPRGQRSFSPISRLDALRDPLRALNDATYVVVQVEGRNGLEQIGDIAAVSGVDAVFVGPYDLALSLNATPGSPQVFAAAKKAVPPLPDGVSMGIYVDDPALCATWAESGFRLQCVSFDGRMLADGARSIVERARSGARKRGRSGQAS
jgi:2-keto-3-deoxy-L-rhamnonate aldolase RhmA